MYISTTVELATYCHHLLLVELVCDPFHQDHKEIPQRVLQGQQTWMEDLTVPPSILELLSESPGTVLLMHITRPCLAFCVQ